MRISRMPIEMDLMVADAFEAIAADPTLALKVIEQVAYLSQNRDDLTGETVHQRNVVIEKLADDVFEAMYQNYERELLTCDDRATDVANHRKPKLRVIENVGRK